MEQRFPTGRLGATTSTFRPRTDHESDYKLLTDIRAAKCGLTELKLSHKRSKEEQHLRLLNALKKGTNGSQVRTRVGALQCAYVPYTVQSNVPAQDMRSATEFP